MIKPDQYFEYSEKELAYLRKKDKKLGAAIDKIGMIQRKTNPNLFSALVESIVSQQISNKAAITVSQRLNALCDMDANRLHLLSAEEIQACGMSMTKASYIKNIAAAAVNKIIDFDTLPEKSDQEIIDSLTTIKGVGVWTVEMLLIFSLMRPDVVSYGDLIIRRNMMALYGLKELPKEKFLRYKKRYSPYGSVASLYLWALPSKD